MKKMKRIIFSLVILTILSGCNLIDDGSIKKVEVIIDIEDDTTLTPKIEVVTAQLDENYLQVKGQNFLSLKPDTYKLVWKVRSKLDTEKEYTYEMQTYKLVVGEDKNKIYIKILGDTLVD